MVWIGRGLRGLASWSRRAVALALAAAIGFAGPEPGAAAADEGHTHSGTVLVALHPKRAPELALSIGPDGSLTLETARSGKPSQQWQVWKGKYFSWSTLHSISADKFIGVPDQPSDRIVANLYNDSQISNEIYIEIIDKKTQEMINDFTTGQQVVIKDSNIGNDFDSMLYLTLDAPPSPTRKALLLFRKYSGKFSAMPDNRVWIIEKVDTTNKTAKSILR